MKKFLLFLLKLFHILESGNNRIRHLFALNLGIDMLILLMRMEKLKKNEEFKNSKNEKLENILGL